MPRRFPPRPRARDGRVYAPPTTQTLADLVIMARRDGFAAVTVRDALGYRVNLTLRDQRNVTGARSGVYVLVAQTIDRDAPVDQLWLLKQAHDMRLSGRLSQASGQTMVIGRFREPEDAA